jgi:hypothetical protein
MTVLGRLFSFGVDLEILARNPVRKLGRVYAGTRVETIWSLEQIDFFVEHAPARIGRAVILGGFSGQRQGDCLALPWNLYDGEFLDVRQAKTEVHVKVPVWGPLASMMNATPNSDRSGTVLTTLDGRKWTSDGFRTEFQKARAAVVERATALRDATSDPEAIKHADKMKAIAELRFSDLRGTAATMLRHAGCTIEEITAVTGHTRGDVNRILDRHYLKNDGTLAKAARMKLQNALQNELGAFEKKLASR